jgi:hypothetical protein
MFLLCGNFFPPRFSCFVDLRFVDLRFFEALFKQSRYGAHEERIVNPFIPCLHRCLLNRLGKENTFPSDLRTHCLSKCVDEQQFFI